MDFDDEDSEFRFPPDWDLPIFSWSRPRYEDAFVLFHPFLRVPEELTIYIEEYSRWLEPPGHEKLANYPIENINWADVMKDLNISNYSFLNDVIMGHAIGSMGLKNATLDDVQNLNSYLRLHKMISPQTHYLPITLKPQIKESINKFGNGNPSWSNSPYEKENLLYATPYECAYSYVLGPKILLETIVQTYNFEGFFADENTKFDWSDCEKMG